MRSFSYSRASNVTAAIQEKAATPGAMFIAGGTNLLDLMKTGVLTPGHLIAITHLGLDKVDAQVQVSGPAGARIIPMAAFHRLPGDTPELDHNLQADELITAIDLPAQSFDRHYAYLKVRDRRSYAFALVSVAAALDLAGDTIRDARIALGGVAPKPWRVPAAEALLAGQPIRRESFRQAAEALLQGGKGFGYNDFKIELAQRAVVRALSLAAHLDPEP
jgi:xanthine dehydrogenase YagS FAD-binding subunit